MLHWKSHFSKNKPLAPVGAAELQSQGSLELSSSPHTSCSGEPGGAATSLCPTQAARLVQVPGRRCWHCPSWDTGRSRRTLQCCTREGDAHLKLDSELAQKH